MSAQLPKQLQSWKARTTSEKLALIVLQKLSSNGFKKSYIVGGYVRDLLLGLDKTGAIDIATQATPKQVQKVLHDFRVIPTGLKHGTVTVHKGEDDIEITTFRAEGKYSDFRRPDTVRYVSDPKIDAGRRDFTVNGLYFNPSAGDFLDFHGGLKDLVGKKLRFIGSALKRISEDPLRLMRAVRFVSVLGFKLGATELSAIKRQTKLIEKISSERVKLELDKIMGTPSRHGGIALLHKTGLLAYIAPEISQMARTVHSKNFHSEGNVFVHTLLALSKLEEGSDLRTAYGLLLHDTGKAVTAVRTKKDNRFHVTFYQHQDRGEEIARALLERLRFSHAEIDEISWYVRHHHVPYELSKMRLGKQMRWALDPRFRNLLRIYRADSLASIPTDRKGKTMESSLESYTKSLKIWEVAQKQTDLNKRLIDGRDVMKVRKIKPGPDVGKILSKVRDLQLSGTLKTREQALKYLKK